MVSTHTDSNKLKLEQKQKSGKRLENRRVVWCNHGFHADQNLMGLVDQLIITSDIRVFIETGTESGSTLGYVARTYPHLKCFSCEADRRIYRVAKENLIRHPNVIIKNTKSVPFLGGGFKPSVRLPITLFWLDAHSHGYGSTLQEELSIIFSRWESGYILIDDFKVLDDPDFRYDEYEFNGEMVTLEQSYIEPTIQNSGRMDEIFLQYPNYKPSYKGRGWVLITFGNAKLVAGGGKVE